QLQWTELQVDANAKYCSPMSSRDSPSLFALHDKVEDRVGSRSIGEMEESEGGKMERLRLIAHPHSMPSLARLSSIAVQKGSGRSLSMLQLQQIGERFV
ncbi:hypothetical protein PMAYCL1PPCAC_31088, partial [Pristionchus mayeri]